MAVAARGPSVSSVAAGDGNGWVGCRCGHQHWGRSGAAGLAVVRDGTLLLQLRAAWTHQGGTWALPGGAADSHEDPATAALREAHEEVGLEPDDLRVVEQVVLTDHEDWAYTTVVAVAGPDLEAVVANDESDEVRWVALDEVTSLPLHPAFSKGWPLLEPALRRALG